MADLEGQMRGLAAHLEIDVPEPGWPALIAAATFASMRRNAAKTVPGASAQQWHDPGGFFNKGTSGQWRDLLDDADMERYATRVRRLAPDRLVRWVHRSPNDPIRW